MPLKLTLKPGEKFVLNGGVLINGDRRADLIIENQVSLLRERDVLQPIEANTPVKRIYFSIMMMYLDGGLESGHYNDFTETMTDFMSILTTESALKKCQHILDEVHEQRFYTALMTCKSLLPFEKERLEYVVQ
ncbi:MAG: flagellum biosynthesis repressor protein FlbT [Alphaproteobacteria bacterium MarineAlpha2_Bin1]|nr:MAG: flagellum biosynthesis repressor protein FlbT [Alphaproteobacteria bacterium MarineAlpha2_Bin1]|tara:strand:+ start:60 stop:458 length:399 start_codon:yes stop_codon:yes gene_type:complete